MAEPIEPTETKVEQDDAKVTTIAPGEVLLDSKTENEEHNSDASMETAKDELQEAKSDYFEIPKDDGTAVLSENAIAEVDESATPNSPSVSSTANGQDSAHQESTSQSNSMSQKKRPGWKGWLRSASSTNTFTIRPDSTRKHMSAQGRASNADRSFQQLEGSFKSARASFASDAELDWAYFEKLLQSNAPRELLQASPFIRTGVSNTFRGMLWQAAAQSKNQELEDVFAELKIDKTGTNDKQISKDLSRMNKNWLKLLERTD